MPKPLRVGIAGIRHSHTPTLVRQWGEIEEAEVGGAADSFPSARALASDEWGIPAIYETWDAMFDSEDLDVVTSTLPKHPARRHCGRLRRARAAGADRKADGERFGRRRPYGASGRVC